MIWSTVYAKDKAGNVQTRGERSRLGRNELSSLLSSSVEEELFSLYPSRLWLSPLMIKHHVNRRKMNRDLITCIPPIYKGDTKES